jgi:hypothetical protein
LGTGLREFDSPGPDQIVTMNAPVAQLDSEHSPTKRGVVGSSPTGCTKVFPHFYFILIVDIVLQL